MLLTPIQIQNSFLKLGPNRKWSFYNIGRSETNAFTHGYHRYPAKFIPHIVRELIVHYTSPGDLICDPFGGCGTTLVESKLLGRRSIGFDINPVAKLITQTKVTPINPKTLENTLKKFTDYYKSIKATSLPINNEKLLYWFDENTIKELNKIYTSIKFIKNYNVRRFYFCAFSHILKNCSRWLMKSIKPTIDKEKIPAIPIEIFYHHLRFMTKRNNQFFNLLTEKNCINTTAKMRIADSTKKLPLKTNSINLIVTSPPYVTSYEYADLHQLSLLWFGNDKDYFKKWDRHIEDFNGFRKRFVGTSLRKNKKKELLNSIIANNIVSELSAKNKSLAESVTHYFSDMNRAFIEMFRILRSNKKAAVIIGDTTLQNIDITNSMVVAEQMQNIGFRPVEFIKREVTNKMITPWRDGEDGRFTSTNNPNKKRVYQYEYLIIMKKI